MRGDATAQLSPRHHVTHMLRSGLRTVGRRMASSTPLRRGEEVDVFYRFSADEAGYFPVLCPAIGTLRPRIGRTDGWVKAKIEEDWPPRSEQTTGLPNQSQHAEIGASSHGDGSSNNVHMNNHGGMHNAGSAHCGPFGESNAFRTEVHGGEKKKQLDPSIVRVRHTHPYWSDRSGERLDPSRDEDMVVNVPRRDIRAASDNQEVALSLLVVRWGGEPTRFNEEQWGAASASVTDTYISAVVDKTIYERYGPDYEVISVFVETSQDVAMVSPGAVLPLMHGRHKAACYFLWPTMMQDGTGGQCGMVSEREYFACMHRMEAAALPTRFPHASQLYRTLLAKEWQSTLCLHSKLCIPPTVSVNRATVATDATRAATKALAALDIVRAERYAAKPEPEEMAAGVGGIRRGVVKLGYSWEASYVTVFRGESQLALALRSLATVAGSEHGALIVQDFVPSSFEARAFVVDGRISHIIYSNFGRIDPAGYPVEFVKLPRAQAVCEWLEGDEAAMSDAEARMKKLVASWLVWLRCRSVEALPALRIDMLVRRTAPGRARLHTLELTELGFSMLAWESGPKEVFGALVRSCFDDVRCAQPQCACHTMCTHAVVPVANGGEGPARKRRRKRSKGGRPAEEAAAAPPSSEAKEPSTPGQ